jgi:transcriptional antiterminator RfaH
MSTFNTGWFVIYTKPRHEKKVADQLENIHINHFLPLVKRLRTWSDRRKYIDTPLFPSYLFVKLEDVQSYFRSLEIDGVLQYVRTGKQITSVNEEVINNLKLIISNLPGKVEVLSESICPGEKLYISEGPFTGFCCEVIQHKGKQKILVRIELLQRSILLDMPVEYLMPVYLVNAV